MPLLACSLFAAPGAAREGYRVRHEVALLADVGSAFSGKFTGHTQTDAFAAQGEGDRWGIQGQYRLSHPRFCLDIGVAKSRLKEADVLTPPTLEGTIRTGEDYHYTTQHADIAVKLPLPHLGVAVHSLIEHAGAPTASRRDFNDSLAGGIGAPNRDRTAFGPWLGVGDLDATYILLGANWARVSRDFDLKYSPSLMGRFFEGETRPALLQPLVQTVIWAPQVYVEFQLLENRGSSRSPRWQARGVLEETLSGDGSVSLATREVDVENFEGTHRAWRAAATFTYYLIPSLGVFASGEYERQHDTIRQTKRFADQVAEARLELQTHDISARYARIGIQVRFNKTWRQKAGATASAGE